MIGKTVSHYKILEKLGEGGMGTVYKAQDLELDRPVALKFVSSSKLAENQDEKRLHREAQAAAALDHSNICTIYEIGRHEDALFIAMAYVDGDDVRKMLRSRPFSIDDAVDISLQVAEGLQTAHEKGIVHRDIKCANIIVTPSGQAKVMDFGLALKQEQSRLTQTGHAVGTTPYMSPEQCRGTDVDHRTDIWALGVVMYEMIAGRLPFEASHASATVYSILNEDPEPLTSIRSRVPIELERIVLKALSKDPGERYQHADELVADLKHLQRTSSTEQVAASGKQRRRFLKSPTPWIGLVLLALAVFVVVMLNPSTGIPFSERDWMLITDFDNETGEEIFDGVISEALSIDLQQSQYVNVFSRQRINRTLQRMGKQDFATIDEATGREVARRENIKAMLAGSVAKVGTSYILSARIVDPATGDAVKTVRAEADGTDAVLGAIDDLSRQVRRDLGESLSSIRNSDLPLDDVTTSSLSALRDYSMGTRHLHKGRWKEAISLFQQAIEKDSSFAIAYSKVSVIYSNLANTEEAQKYSAMAVQRADQVTDRERYYIEALYYEARGNRRGAIEQYKLLVQHYPDDFVGQNNLSFNYMYVHRYDHGLEHALEAARISPDSWYSHHNLAGIYAGLADYNKAIEESEMALEVNPEGYWSRLVRAFIYSCRDEPSIAFDEVNKLPAAEGSWQSLKLSSLSDIARSMGQDQRAMEYLKKGISIDEIAGRESAGAFKWRQLGEIHGNGGDLDAALEAFRNSLTHSRGFLGLLGYGRCLAAAGRLQEAEAVLTEMNEPVAFERYPADIAAIERLKGHIAFARKDYDGAARFFENSLVLTETFPAFYSLGFAHLAAHRYTQAAAAWHRVIDNRYATFFDGFAYLWALSNYQLGIAYEALGETEKAVGAYRQFLSVWNDADPGRVEVADAQHRLDALRTN